MIQIKSIEKQAFMNLVSFLSTRFDVSLNQVPNKFQFMEDREGVNEFLRELKLKLSEPFINDTSIISLLKILESEEKLSSKDKKEIKEILYFLLKFIEKTNDYLEFVKSTGKLGDIVKKRSQYNALFKNFVLVLIRLMEIIE